MMKRNNMIFLFLISFNLLAQDCGEIKDGEVKRLDKENMSLSKAKVQDQDGIGSCYANTASLLLQAALPGNPDVSYLHLAMNYAENNEAARQRRDGKMRVVNRETGTDGKIKESMLFEGGFICETIMHAKNSGGVCPRNTVALENMLEADGSIIRDTNQKQLDILKKVSQYYDSVLQNFQSKNLPEPVRVKKKGQVGFFASLFGNNQKNQNEESAPKTKIEEEKYNNFRKAMLDLIQKREKEFDREACLKPNPENVLDVTKNVIARLEKEFNNPKIKKNEKLQIQLFGIYVGKRERGVNSNGEISFYIDQNFKNRIDSQYLKMLNSPNPPASAEAAYKALIAKSFDIDPKFVDKIMGQLSPYDKKKLDSDYSRYVKKDAVDCGSVKKIDYITDENGLIKDAEKDSCLRQYVGLVKDFREMVIGLDKNNFRNVKSMNDFLENLLGTKYDDAMMTMLAPECTPDKKIKIPDNLNCDVTNINYPEAAKTDPLLEAAFMGETRQKFRQDFSSAIKSNKPIGVSVCTVFFEKGKDSFYNKSGVCDPEKKHGFHAVTMMGYKCQRGKMKYLMQNSWGDWEAANEKFEADTGKAWMDEDDLAKNLYRYDQVR